MRVLWFSNKVLSEQDMATTGSWLGPMARGLINSGQVELGNLGQGRVDEVSRQDYGSICQWIIPSVNELPSQRQIMEIKEIVDTFSPDLIHVWGMEHLLGLLTARKIIQIPTLLEVQGLKGNISQVFYGGLTLQERLACVGIKELLLWRFLGNERRKFRVWGIFEREMILRHRYITTLSSWVESWVKGVNPDCITYHNEVILRESFYNSSPWKFTGSVTLFCIMAYPAPFKGLHIAIKALSILKRKFPDIQLHIAGYLRYPGIHKSGYIKWIEREAKRSGVEKNITWLGPLTADEIINELLKSSVMVLPSFIESYCVSLVEAMILGVPAVSSYNGAPYIAQDVDPILFFPPGDVEKCASQIERLLIDQTLTEELSRRARDSILIRNNKTAIIQHQIEIYKQVLSLN